MRKNAISLNILFFRANNGNNEISELIRQKFEEIIDSNELHFLITDPDYNGNNGIISVYMKNKNLFSYFLYLLCVTLYQPYLFSAIFKSSRLSSTEQKVWVLMTSSSFLSREGQVS